MNEQDEQRARRTAEEIQLVLEGYLVNQQKHEVANIIAAALAAVREECAVIADGQARAESTLGAIKQENLHRHGRHIAATIAAAIRGSQKR